MCDKRKQDHRIKESKNFTPRRDFRQVRAEVNKSKEDKGVRQTKSRHCSTEQQKQWKNTSRCVCMCVCACEAERQRK